MAKIVTRKETSKLVIDFTYRGVCCREQTALSDEPSNRKRLEAVLKKMQAALKDGSFNYQDFFPNSRLTKRFVATPPTVALPPHSSSGVPTNIDAPTFEDFANQWFEEKQVEWRRSHIRSLRSTLDSRILPIFGPKVVSSITKSDILTFRANLAKEPGRGGKDGLSPKRINEITGALCQIVAEAADRFEFTSPTANIKRLRVRRADVNPFSLQEVQTIIKTAREDYRNYFTVRFLTGMRTGEVHGLKWRYVDFSRRLILIRETFVLGEDDYTKTDGSQRDIQMSVPVYEALCQQYEATGQKSDYVFCNMVGSPLDNKNFTDRVWYPLLRHLGLEERKPYQMRHTAATLWLASGEAPEWIARQMGHTSTEMLFKVYSRYVPNLTRQDGSAMERLLASQLSTGQLTTMPPAAQKHLRSIQGDALFEFTPPLSHTRPATSLHRPDMVLRADIAPVRPIDKRHR